MGTITGTDNSEVINGTNGDDTIYGLGGNDTLNGLAGHDILIGGPGADVLNGGPDSDIYQDTAANFNGDEITNLKIGDQIQITDLDLSHGSVGLSGNFINYNNNGVAGSIKIDNIGPGRLVLRLTNGGVDLRLQENAHNDFNGDGRSDILWRDQNGNIVTWLADANGAFSSNWNNSIRNVTADWHVVGTGDFNGDGREDILWRNDNGTIVDWLGNANGGFTSNYANTAISVPTSWQVVGTADFNGDGKTDILWRNSSGTIVDWLATANGGFTSNYANSAANVPTNWHVVGTGDFNGDGYQDILWRDDAGEVTNWLGNSAGGFTDNSAQAFNYVPTSWTVAGTGDFNGDGISDVLWRNTDGTIVDWLGQANGGFTSNYNNSVATVPTSWTIASIGDFNGDSHDDILWRNSDGSLTDWLGTATGGFMDNSAHAGTSIPTNWHVQDAFF